MSINPVRNDRAHTSAGRRPHISLRAEQLEVRDLLAADLLPLADFVEGEAVAPTVDADAKLVSRQSGSTATNSGVYAGDVATLSASLGAVVDNGDGTWSWNFDTRLTNVGTYDVTITAADALANEATTTFSLTVHNYSQQLHAVATSFSTLNSTDFVIQGDYVYFTGYPVTGGRQLFKTDGTSTPVQISGFSGDNYNYNASNLLVVGDVLYYFARDIGGTVGIWKTDGVPGQTEKIADLPWGDASSFVFRSMAYVDGYIYLRNLQPSDVVELWKMDVESGQFDKVADVTPGSPYFISSRMVSVGDVVYFFANDGDGPLWRSDGTAEGTYKVESTPGVNVTKFTQYDGSLFFVTNDGATSSVWRIDESGVNRVFQTMSTEETNWFGALHTGGDHLLFAMNRNGKTGDVWSWNETTEEMELVANLIDLGFNLVSSVSTYNGLLYIRETVPGTNSAYDQNLWRSDGTLEGTFRLIGESELTDFYVYNYYATDAGFFLLIKDAVNGYELWTTDGTVAGTYPTTQWQSPSNNSGTRGIEPVGQRIIMGLRYSTEDSDQIYTLQAGPTVNISGPVYGLVGDVLQLDASGTFDNIDAQQDLTFEWDIDGDGEYDDAVGLTLTLALDTPGLQRIGLRVTDQEGAATYAVSTIRTNAPPTIDIENQSLTVGEGSVAINLGTLYDSADDVVTLTASLGMVIDNHDGTWSWSYHAPDGPVPLQTVTITATDSGGLSDQVEFELIVKNIPPSIAIAQNQVNIDATLVATNTGTYGDPIDFPIDLSVSLGAIVNNGDGTWSWSYATDLVDIGEHEVTITADDGDGGITQTSFTLFVLPVPEAALTLNADAPVTDNQGQVTTLPPSFARIDEWDSLTANVWIRRPARIDGSLNNVTLDLHFNDLWYKLESFVRGSGVGQLQINNTGDAIEIDASQFASGDAALDGYLLVGSFRFRPNPDGGVPNHIVGAYPTPLDPQFSLSDIFLTTSEVVDQFGLQTEFPETELHVVPYDLDDDGSIGLSDLTMLIGKVGNPVATNPDSYPYDFDRDGRVTLTDLIYMIRNIGVTRDSDDSILLPPETPPQPLLETESTTLLPPVTASSLLEGEAIAPSDSPTSSESDDHNFDAAFGNLGLLEACWELPSEDEEAEDVETAFSFPDPQWQPEQLPEWALQASTITDCVVEKALSILDDLEEEHPRFAQAIDRLKSRLENL